MKSSDEFTKVALGILRDNHAIFLQRRPEDKKFGGLWELPGGKVEEKEEPVFTLGRELAEELDIIVKSYSLFDVSEYRYPDIAVQLYAYIVKDYIGEPILHEATESLWLLPSEALKLDLVPATRIIIEKL